MPRRNADGGGPKKKVVYVKTRGGKVINYSKSGIKPPTPRVVARPQVKVNPRVAADNAPRPFKRPKVKRAGYAELSPVGKKTVAPVLTALDYSARPLHTIAGGELQALKGGLNVQNADKIVKEAKKGATGKTHHGTADILKELGVPGKGLRAALGQVGDVVGDPTTYVTGGGASLARHAATDGAEAAAKSAFKKAMKTAERNGVADKAAREKFAKPFADMARRQAAKKGADAKGFEGHVKFAGKTVARVKVKQGKFTEGGVPVKVPDKVRKVVQHVRPTIRASEATPALERPHVLSVRREQRAIQNESIDKAKRHAEHLADRIPRDAHATVIDAIERGRIGKLPEDLRGPARDLRDTYRHHSRLRRQAGVKQGTIGDYFPHMRATAIKRGEANTEAEALQMEARRAGTSVGSTKKRQIRDTLQGANQRVKKGDEFSTDVPVVHANYEVQTGRLLANAHGAQEARQIGGPVKVSKPLKPGEHGPKAPRVRVPKLSDNEVLVHVGKKPRVLDKAEVAALKRGETPFPEAKGGTFRVMAAETARELTRPVQQQAGGFTRKVVHPWKSVATATPAFHVRNAIGDAERAYTAGIKARDMPRLFKDAGQMIRYYHQNPATIGKGNAEAVARKTMSDKAVMDLGKSGKVSVKDFAAELKRNGLIRAGTRGSELQHIGGDTGRFRMSKPARAGRKANRVLQDRENITYVALYKHFRETGLGERDAARKTMDALVDYGEVTPVEQALRNTAVPFYTFQSRVVPFYAKSLVQRPGKIAAYQKLRENTARATGQDPGSLEKESEYKQRQAGLPIGGKFVSAGLPLAQGVNEAAAIPALGLKGGTQELARYAIGSLAPWVKAPAELGPLAMGTPGSQGGFNYFFEAPVESQHKRYVTAPAIPGLSWDKIPEGTREKLGVKQIVDRRTGKTVWGWRGWKSYLTQNALPGAPGFALRVGQSLNQRGQDQKQQVAGFLTGVKIDNPDPIGAAIDRAYAQLDLTSALKSDMAQEPGGKDKPEYKKLALQEKALQTTIYSLSKKRGDKKPLQDRSGGKAKGGNEMMPGGSVSGNELMPR